MLILVHEHYECHANYIIQGVDLLTLSLCTFDLVTTSAFMSLMYKILCYVNMCRPVYTCR